MEFPCTSRSFPRQSSSCLSNQVSRYMCGPLPNGRSGTATLLVSWMRVPGLMASTQRNSDGDESASPPPLVLCHDSLQRNKARCTDSPLPISRPRRRSAPLRNFPSARTSSSPPSAVSLVRSTPILLQDFRFFTRRGQVEKFHGEHSRRRLSPRIWLICAGSLVWHVAGSLAAPRWSISHARGVELDMPRDSACS